MNTHSHRTIRLDGSFTLDLSAARAFPLFSPEGERAWVEGWDPEILHPENGSWSVDQVFRTRSDGRETTWIVTQLDPEKHTVKYWRVEGGDLAATVAVRCAEVERARTRVEVSYAFFALSHEGDAEIAAMSEPAFAEKMKNWKRAIERKR